jgi:pseudo-rSAM protein
MKKYWLTLRPYTFLWIKEDKCFIYQSINNKKSLILLKNEKIKDISHQLLITTNLYTVELSDENLKDKEFKRWIDAIINIDAGYITINDGLNKKPVSLKPILKIQNNVDVYISQHNSGINGDIIHNLHEITFYINRSDYGSNSWYWQTIFPLKECDELDKKK